MKNPICTVFAIIFILSFFIGSCTSKEDNSSIYDLEIDHAQGEMSGEATQSSIILQSRLTLGDKPIDGDILGTRGTACFEISERNSFENSFTTDWMDGAPEKDFIVKTKIDRLKSGKQYYYRLLYGPESGRVKIGRTCTFKTLSDIHENNRVEFVAVTGMHYHLFHYGYHEVDKLALENEDEDSSRPSLKHIFNLQPLTAYAGSDKHLGPPALEAILDLNPDFFVGTGDNVYYDEPLETAAQTQPELRKKYHEQFIQPRFIELFAQVPTYWEKDDHDYRFNDAYPSAESDPLMKPARSGDKEPWGPSHELGIETFIEQLPVADPLASQPITYRTHRINKLLQIWLVEGRDYRSPHDMPDGPDKTLWGEQQKKWLKKTLSESTAAFKILISPTPMVGPDDGYKADNHTNPNGFKYEAGEFFSWLKDNGFSDKNFYVICGDRHWQYHSIHPSGFEEFSCGALVDANSRLGRKPGDPDSTDPNGEIKQPYFQEVASGGFLAVTADAGNKARSPSLEFSFYDENGILLYKTNKALSKKRE